MIRTRRIVAGYVRIWDGVDAYRPTLVFRWKGRHWWERRWTL